MHEKGNVDAEVCALVQSAGNFASEPCQFASPCVTQIYQIKYPALSVHFLLMFSTPHNIAGSDRKTLDGRANFKESRLGDIHRRHNNVGVVRYATYVKNL